MQIPSPRIRMAARFHDGNFQFDAVGQTQLFTPSIFTPSIAAFQRLAEGKSINFWRLDVQHDADRLVHDGD